MEYLAVSVAVAADTDGVSSIDPPLAGQLLPRKAQKLCVPCAPPLARLRSSECMLLALFTQHRLS
jgi:hypothetical protein